MPSNELAIPQDILLTCRHEKTQQLFSHHNGWLRSWLHKRVGCPEVAADLAQDTFLRLLTKPRKLDSFAGARRYLRTVADGLCIDMWRRKSVEQAWLETLAQHSQYSQKTVLSPEDQAVIIETLYEIDSMLNRLPTKVANAFVLSQVEGLTYKQIAEQLGVSDRMVKKYMARAMLECVLIEARFLDTRIKVEVDRCSSPQTDNQ